MNCEWKEYRSLIFQMTIKRSSRAEWDNHTDRSFGDPVLRVSDSIPVSDTGTRFSPQRGHYYFTPHLAVLVQNAVLVALLGGLAVFHLQDGRVRQGALELQLWLRSRGHRKWLGVAGLERPHVFADSRGTLAHVDLCPGDEPGDPIDCLLQLVRFLFAFTALERFTAEGAEQQRKEQVENLKKKQILQLLMQLCQAFKYSRTYHEVRNAHRQ